MENTIQRKIDKLNNEIDRLHEEIGNLDNCTRARRIKINIQLDSLVNQRRKLEELLEPNHATHAEIDFVRCPKCKTNYCSKCFSNCPDCEYFRKPYTSNI